MTKTAVATQDPEFDIRACPIWAIPQLVELRRRVGGTLLEFHNFGNGEGRFKIKIWELGCYVVYYGYFHKNDMNDYRHPAMAEFELGWYR